MIVLADVGGYCMPGFSCMMLSVELSTIFINFRSLYDKKDFGLFFPQVCQVLFFLSFTGLRMIGIPYSIYMLFKSSQVTWPHLEAGRQFCWVSSISFFVGIYFLNIYWYTLILKGIAKLIGYDKTDKAVMDKTNSNEKLHNY